jgi:hypothetical protein
VDLRLLQDEEGEGQEQRQVHVLLYVQAECDIKYKAMIDSVLNDIRSHCIGVTLVMRIFSRTGLFLSIYGRGHTGILVTGTEAGPGLFPSATSPAATFALPNFAVEFSFLRALF